MHTLGVCILDAYPLQPSSPSCRAAPKRYVGLPQNVLPTLTLTVMPDFSSLKRRAGLPKKRRAGLDPASAAGEYDLAA